MESRWRAHDRDQVLTKLLIKLLLLLPLLLLLLLLLLPLLPLLLVLLPRRDDDYYYHYTKFLAPGTVQHFVGIHKAARAPFLDSKPQIRTRCLWCIGHCLSTLGLHCCAR